MMRIGLVACGKNKLPYRAPARELYQGDLFKKSSRYAEDNYDKWFILSALHGVIRPDIELDPYDVSLVNAKVAEKRAWAKMVYRQLMMIDPSAIYFFHAGKDYRLHLSKMLKPLKYRAPLMGLGIGEQLRWYKERGY